MANERNDFALAQSERRRRKTTIRAVLVLLGVVLGGVIGLMIIEDWTFWHSLYFTLITITTVGFSDEGISEHGQRFVSLLMVGGIGSASYAFAILVQNLITSQFAWKRRMQTRIDKQSDHTIVCGFGRMGRTICQELIRAQLPFVIIESDGDSYMRACEMDYLAVEGSAAEDEVLLQAGLERAKHVIAGLDSKAENIVITLTAREYRPDITIIARAEKENEVRKLMRAGAKRVVSPFHTGGLEVANAIIRPNVSDFLARSSKAESNVALADVLVSEGSLLENTALADYGRREASRVSFVALERVGEESKIPPSGSECLRAGDLLIVAGDPQQIERMRLHALTEDTGSLPASVAGSMRESMPEPPPALPSKEVEKERRQARVD